MVPVIAPIVAELGLELAPLVIYGGYKTVDFLNKGGGKAIKSMIKQKDSKDSKVKK